jgi:hypothetical protein
VARISGFWELFPIGKSHRSSLRSIERPVHGGRWTRFIPLQRYLILVVGHRSGNSSAWGQEGGSGLVGVEVRQRCSSLVVASGGRGERERGEDGEAV